MRGAEEGGGEEREGSRSGQFLKVAGYEGHYAKEEEEETAATTRFIVSIIAPMTLAQR